MIVIGPDFMRVAKLADHAAVEALLVRAFGGPDEAGLVAGLRAAGAMEAEFVMPWEHGIVGYLAFSRLVAPEGWLALAPVAVAPEWQGRRLGVRLVSMAVQLMALRGATVVVLGKPSFYGRCGFSNARAAGLRAPYRNANLLIARAGEDVPEVEVIYPAAFAGV